MRFARKLAAAGIALAAIYLFVTSGVFQSAKDSAIAYIDQHRERQAVALTEEAAPPQGSRTPEENKPAPSSSPSPAPTPKTGLSAEDMIETTIAGGLNVKNGTKFDIDIHKLLAAGAGITLEAEKPQILIIHTHSSEAYTPAGLDKYDASDTSRTEDKEFNVIRIGDELESILTEAGLQVIHDRGVYDYPSYTGSYTRSGEAVQRYLEQYPTIKIVIDLHRDAIGAGDAVYKTVAEEEGVCASQVMLLVGTNESGLEHPYWRDNLQLALYLQSEVSIAHPTLMRPVEIVPQRYNQHLSRGSMILEVGSSGNTLQEALAGIRLFGNAAADALVKLVE